MSKRILAMLLAVVMVASCLPVGVLAENEPHIHCACGKEKTLAAACENCGTKAVEWTGVDTLPTANGHYYLTEHVSAELVEYGPGAEVSICLHGQNITSTNGERILTVAAGGAKVVITDCAQVQGAITGGTVNKYGSALRVNQGSTLTMYGGKITGNTAPAAGDGTVYVGEGTASAVGGTFYMYGGEITGNTARRGSGVFIANPGTTKKPGTAYILGGKITGNTGKGTGGTKGGAGILAFGPVVIGGNAQVYGNTVADGPADIYLRDSGYPGALAVSSDVPLTDGAKIEFGSDSGTLASLSGNPAQWNCHWVTMGGQNVSFANGAFVLGHYHGDQEYQPVSGNAAVRDFTGYGYLTTDLKLGGPQTWKVDKHLCLNGHSITAKAGNRVFSTENASPVTIVIQDCSAYTDETGVYHAGKLTGGENTSGGGGAFNVAVGSKICLQDGIITGNKSAVAAGAILVNGEFCMEGGQISNNEAKASDGTLKNGAAIQMNSNAKVAISGGTITGHTAAKGAAIYGNGSNATYEFTGGTITGNTSNEGGAVFAGANVTVKLSGKPVITGNKIGEQEANLYLAGSNTMQVGTMDSGAKVGISAEAVGRTVSNACADHSACFTSDAQGYKVLYQDGALYLGAPIDHKHNVCGDSACEDHEVLGFTAWNSTNSLPESGDYYLTDDVVLTKQATLDNTKVNLCLNGHTVKVREGSSLRFFYLKGDAELTITDCAAVPGIMAGAAKSAIMTENVADSAPVINLYAGVLTGNKGEAGGGAIMLQGKAVFNMYGGSITGNSVAGALGGGGVSQYSKDAAFNMYGGAITNNTAAKTDAGKGGVGGGAYIRGAFNMYGGTISGNAAEVLGGGIYLEDQAKDVTLDGCARVSDNTANEATSNLYASGGQLLQIGKLSSDSKVGISGFAAFCPVSGKCEDYSAQVTSDLSDHKVLYQDGALYLDGPSDHNHCLCTAKKEGCDHVGVKFAPWDKTDSLPTTGNYYLTADVVITKQATMDGGNVVLCLNGHTVTTKEGSSLRFYYLKADARLSITDCSHKPGTMTGATRSAVMTENVETSAPVFSLYNGILTGNEGETGGGAVLLQGKGVFNMYGGQLTKNTVGGSMGGGAVFQYGTDTVFNLYDGVISENSATVLERKDDKGVSTFVGGNGGAVYGRGIVNICGGSVTGNAAGAHGGAIYMATGSQFSMTGGTVSNNTAAKYGGGLYLLKQEVLLTGGSITGNRAALGGGMYLNGAAVTVKDFAISGNAADEGAGAYVNTTISETDGAFPATLILEKGAVVQGNKAAKNGGGAVVNADNAHLKLSGGTISGNSAKNAGGVLLQGKSKMTVQSGSVTGNTANSGGGIYASTNAELILSGGSVNNNSATKNAGGIYLLRAKATLKGGTISGNKGESGGGVYAAGSKVTLSGTAISGNTAVKNGGGLMALNSSLTKNGVKTLYECTVDMVGGTIRDNKAINAGGVLLQGTGTVFNLKGGAIAHNHATSTGGGVYVSTNGTMNMTGGAVEENTTDKYGGGIWVNKGTAKLDAGEVRANAVPTSGGGVVAANSSKVTLGKDLKVWHNTAKAAAGLLCQGRAVLTVEGAEVYGNTSTALGAGLYVSTNSTTVVKGAHFHDNHSKSNGGAMFCNQNGSLQVEDTLIENNIADLGGGGVFNRGKTVITGCQIRGNQATTEGGGLGSYKMSFQGGMHVVDTVITGNTSGTRGGGIYFSLGCVGSVKNVTIRDNVAAEEGGALWAMEDLTIDGLTATGNQSGGEGYAVYLNDSDYDGESYMAGVMKMGGDVIVKDNKGGDMYLGEMTTVSIPGGIIGEKTHINITIASGVLTQKVFGQYNYEGGNRVYTITYGDRSMTDPETVPGVQDAQTENTGVADVLLYVGVGVFALAVAAVAVILVIKKKKTAAQSAQK